MTLHGNLSKQLFELIFGSRAAIEASRTMGWLAKIPLPQPIINSLIQLYSMGFGVDMQGVAVPPEGFNSFGDFFGRRLRADARPIAKGKRAVVSPCDGEVTAFGRIDLTEEPVFAIKGHQYSIGSLVGDAEGTECFAGGTFVVIYLHPRDYHRVHAPTALSLTQIRTIPGARFSVARWCENLADNIYEKNERVVFNGTLPKEGVFSLIMVAAFGVGNIESKYHPESASRVGSYMQRDMNPPVCLDKGEEMGAFLLGSTVVMIWSKGAIALDENLKLGPIKMG
jgi:phosphatidylserine decarboxylase